MDNAVDYNLFSVPGRAAGSTKDKVTNQAKTPMTLLMAVYDGPVKIIVAALLHFPSF